MEAINLTIHIVRCAVGLTAIQAACDDARFGMLGVLFLEIPQLSLIGSPDRGFINLKTERSPEIDDVLRSK